MKQLKKRSSLKELRLSHTTDAIRRRLAKGPQHSYLKDFIYGAIDGSVTTFAVVAGVTGAKLSPGIVIILGFCNLLADGFSMGVSNFLGTRAEQEQRIKAEREEKTHIELIPEGEKEEIRQIFAAKGFQGKDLERIVSVISSDKRLWLSTMIQEEWGFPREMSSPLKAASTTFFAFLTIGFLPLLSYVVAYLFPRLTFHAFSWSTIVTASAFFIIGTLKSRFVGKKWYICGAETLLVGGSAATLAYIIGVVLRGVY